MLRRAITTATVTAVGITAVLTKPSDSTFKPHCKKWFDKELKHEFRRNREDGVSSYVLRCVASGAMEYLVDYDVQDCVLFKIGRCDIDKYSEHFIGTFNGWYYLGETEH